MSQEVVDVAEKKSGFHYLGIGCLVLGAILVLGATVCGYGVYRWGKSLESDLEDPEARRERVLEILRGSDMPEGYYPMIAVRIPMLLETAMLTDHDAGPGEPVPDLGERGLLYFAMRDFGRDRQDLDAFFRGELEDPAALEKHQIDVDLGERVASGRVDRSTTEILWVAHRGNISSGQTRGSHEGLITLLQVNCPPDSYNRIGMWFGPEPDSEEGSLVGSVADSAQVETFLGHFGFCPD